MLQSVIALSCEMKSRTSPENYYFVSFFSEIDERGVCVCMCVCVMYRVFCSKIDARGVWWHIPWIHYYTSNMSTRTILVIVKRYQAELCQPGGTDAPCLFAVFIRCSTSYKTMCSKVFVHFLLLETYIRLFRENILYATYSTFSRNASHTYCNTSRI